MELHQPVESPLDRLPLGQRLEAFHSWPLHHFHVDSEAGAVTWAV
ncbi:hypothetical protein AB0C52_12175 [Streptomyces sp. NPDC048717]